MVKCSFCNRRAVYVSKTSGKAYCEKHFLEYFDRKVRRTIRKYRMLTGHEHIIIAVSGGKDSLSLIHYFSNLAKNVPGWKISALLIDEGIKGYRDEAIKDFLEVVEELKVDYKIVSFKEEIGLTLDELVEKSKKLKLPYLPCSYCGVFRRYLLNKYARIMGGTVLATAHNLDDIIQTFLINVMKNDWNKIIRLTPVSRTGLHAKLVKRIKPFYEILEKETTLYAILNNIYPKHTSQCPYAVLSSRWHLRHFLNKLEEMNPGTKYSTLNSLLHVLETYSAKENVEQIGSCKICGEPSSHEICRACFFKMKLGLLNSQDFNG